MFVVLCPHPLWSGTILRFLFLFFFFYGIGVQFLLLYNKKSSDEFHTLPAAPTTASRWQLCTATLSRLLCRMVWTRFYFLTTVKTEHAQLLLEGKRKVQPGILEGYKCFFLWKNCTVRNRFNAGEQTRVVPLCPLSCQ